MLACVLRHSYFKPGFISRSQILYHITRFHDNSLSNALQCSPHPRKRRTNIPESFEKQSEDQQPSTSSTYHLDDEFVHAYNEVKKLSPSQSESDSVSDKDLLGETEQPYGLPKIKAELVSDDDNHSSHTTSDENFPVRKAMCSTPSQIPHSVRLIPFLVLH